jgi:hypothetical protein
MAMGFSGDYPTDAVITESRSDFQRSVASGWMFNGVCGHHHYSNPDAVYDAQNL